MASSNIRPLSPSVSTPLLPLPSIDDARRPRNPAGARNPSFQIRASEPPIPPVPGRDSAPEAAGLGFDRSPAASASAAGVAELEEAHRLDGFSVSEGLPSGGFVVSRARIRADPGGEGDEHGDPAVVAPPNSEGFRLAEAENSGLRRRRVIGLFAAACGLASSSTV